MNDDSSFVARVPGVHDVKYVETNPEWGDLNNYFTGAIDWAEQNLAVGQMVFGSYVDNDQTLPFQIFRTVHHGVRARFHLRQRRYIEYTDHNAFVKDSGGTRYETWQRLLVDGKKQWVREWRLQKVDNPEFMKHPGATFSTLWRQCMYLVHPYAIRFGVSPNQPKHPLYGAWERMKQVVESDYARPPQRVYDLFHYLHAFQSEWSPTNDWFTENDLARLRNKVQAILDLNGPYRVLWVKNPDGTRNDYKEYITDFGDTEVVSSTDKDNAATIDNYASACDMMNEFAAFAEQQGWTGFVQIVAGDAEDVVAEREVGDVGPWQLVWFLNGETMYLNGLHGRTVFRSDDPMQATRYTQLDGIDGAHANFDLYQEALEGRGGELRLVGVVGHGREPMIVRKVAL